MRLIARAPVTVAGRDIRPGDTFDAPEQEANSLLALEVVEIVAEQGPKDAKKKRASE